MSILRKNKRLFAEVLSDLKNHVDLSLMTISPMIAKNYTNKASQMVQSSFSLILEYTMYALAAICFLLLFVLKSVGPFSILAQIETKQAVLEALGTTQISSLVLTIRVMFVVIAVLFVLIGFLIRKNRGQKDHMFHSCQELKRIEDYLISSSDDLNLIDSNYSILKDGQTPPNQEN